MIEAIKKLFGLKTTNYDQLIKEGAIILDVRTPGEFSTGHINDAINIPVDKLSQNLDKLNAKNKPVITCCASGIRSAKAKVILQSNGYKKVYNGGAWHRLNLKLGN
jgi:rhodanese-related sulfurtransferase